MIPAFLNNVEWETLPPQDDSNGMPYATHSGVLELMGKKLRCFQLSNGEAVFDADDFNEFMEEFLKEDNEA